MCSSSGCRHIAGRTSWPRARWPTRVLQRCHLFPQRADLKPPGGAARRPRPGAGRSCFKLRRPAGRRLSLGAWERPQLFAPRLQRRPRPGPGPRTSPAAGQGAGLPAITSSTQLRHPQEPRVRPCKLRLLHLPPLSQPGRVSELWPTRGYSYWASSWPSWAGSEPSSVRQCPSGKVTPMQATTS